MRRLRARLLAEDGISAVEMLIASAIALVVLTSALQLVDTSVRAERAQDARHQALLELRGAVGRLSKELRQATSIDPSSTRSRLEVQTLVNGIDRHIVYEIVEGSLNRSLDGGHSIQLAGQVATSEPFCYDPPICQLSSPAPVSTFVGVSLTVRPAAFSAEPIALETEVELRNL